MITHPSPETMRAPLSPYERTELSASQNLLDVIVLPCNGNGGGVGGTVEIVAICGAELAKEDLHRRGGLEGEPSVGAVVRELAR